MRDGEILQNVGELLQGVGRYQANFQVYVANAPSTIRASERLQNNWSADSSRNATSGIDVLTTIS